MSDASPASKQPNQEKLRKYLTFMLNASPQAESERIVTKRMKAMRLVEENPREVTAAQAAQENLLETKAKLEELRAGIWDQPVDALQPELQRLAAQAPEHLRPLVGRLQLILRSRPTLESLVSGEKTQYEIDADFLTVFKQVLQSNPQERAELRERSLMAFRNRRLRKQGWKTLKQLEGTLPELCELEAEWISRLWKQRGTGMLSVLDFMSKDKMTLFEKFKFYVVILILCLGVYYAVVTLMTMLSRALGGT